MVKHLNGYEISQKLTQNVKFMSIIFCSIHNKLRQMTLTLKDKCEAKLNLTWLNTFYLLMIRVPSAVLISCCTKPLSKVALLTQNS